MRHRQKIDVEKFRDAVRNFLLCKPKQSSTSSVLVTYRFWLLLLVSEANFLLAFGSKPSLNL